MFRPEAHAHEPRRNSPEQWIPVEETHDAWNLDGTLRLQCPDEDTVLHDHLHPLRDSGWEFPAPLNRLQLRSRWDAALKRLVEEVRRRHRILNREVDASPSGSRSSFPDG